MSTQHTARQNFSVESEKGLNDQINLEYKASLIYASMRAYFGRDNVALPGLEAFFAKSSEEERQHAEKLISYTNMRGGRPEIGFIEAPQVEWKSALNAVECALQLEKDVNESLLKLHKVAELSNDPQFCDYLEKEYLEEQVRAIKDLTDYITQLKRVEAEGLGLYLWDQNLLNKVGSKSVVYA